MEPNELKHYGVKGMKWGVRRSQAALDRAAGRRPAGVSRTTNRRARRDAKETARAKMFYGDGAGNRRKLQKAKVNQRSKDSSYKKAYEHHLSRQNMGKHANKAIGERRRKDAAAGVARTARGVKNLAMNTGAPVTVAALGVFAVATNPQARKFATRMGNRAMQTVNNARQAKAGRDWLKEKGFL